MAWTTYDKVRERAPKRFVDAAGWTEAEIIKRITRGDTLLAPRLTRLFGEDLVTGWGSSPPPLIGDLAADQAAVLCLADAHGESQFEPGSPGADAQERIDKALAGMADGSLTLVDSAGATVIGPDSYDSEDLATFGSTSQDQEPVFTSGREALDKTKRGTLDRY